MPIKVLVADESRTIRKVCELIFDQTEFSLQAVDTLDRLLSCTVDSPDVIVLSLSLTNEAPEKICSKLKELFPGSRILLMTSVSTELSDSKVKLYGADVSIIKPFESEHMLDQIRALHKRARSSADSTPTVTPAIIPSVELSTPLEEFSMTLPQVEELPKPTPAIVEEHAQEVFEFTEASAPPSESVPAFNLSSFADKHEMVSSLPSDERLVPEEAPATVLVSAPGSDSSKRDDDFGDLNDEPVPVFSSGMMQSSVDFTRSAFDLPTGPITSPSSSVPPAFEAEECKSNSSVLTETAFQTQETSIFAESTLQTSLRHNSVEVSAFTTETAPSTVTETITPISSSAQVPSAFDTVPEPILPSASSSESTTISGTSSKTESVFESLSRDDLMQMAWSALPEKAAELEHSLQNLATQPTTPDSIPEEKTPIPQFSGTLSEDMIRDHLLTILSKERTEAIFKETAENMFREYLSKLLENFKYSL